MVFHAYMLPLKGGDIRRAEIPGVSQSCAFWKAISEMSAGTGISLNVAEQLWMKLNTACKLKTV
jgi:hypothetical protein